MHTHMRDLGERVYAAVRVGLGSWCCLFSSTLIQKVNSSASGPVSVDIHGTLCLVYAMCGTLYYFFLKYSLTTV